MLAHLSLAGDPTPTGLRSFLCGAQTFKPRICEPLRKPLPRGSVNSPVAWGQARSMVIVATAVGAKSKERGYTYTATYRDIGGRQTMQRILFVAVLGILILMLAACGGSSSTGSGAKSGEHSGGGATTAEEGTTAGGGTTTEAVGTPGGEVIRTIVIKESEFKLDPSKVALDKPGTYIFEAKNTGTFTHALEIEGNGVEAETRQLNAGSSAKIKVEFKSPGTYEMYCPVDGHRAEGMEGKITVK